MAARLPAFALLLLLAAPLASACSYAYPDPYGRIAWHDDLTLLTTRDWQTGFYHLGNATFQPLAPGFPRLLHAASPDGAWFIHSEPGRVLDGGMCAREPGALLALDTATGASRALQPGDATDAVGSRERLAVAMGHEVLLYRWGRWDAPERRVDLRGVDAGSLGEEVYAQRLRFSPDGASLGMILSNYVREAVLVLPLQGAGEPILLDPEASPRIVDFAFAPGGDRVALLRAMDLLVANLSGPARGLDARNVTLEGGVALAWGPPGLAVARTRHGPKHDPLGAEALLHEEMPPREEPRAWRWEGAPASGGLAWSPNGTRLAFAEGGRIHLLDVPGAVPVPTPPPSGAPPPASSPAQPAPSTPRETPAPAALLLVALAAVLACLRRGAR